MGMGKSLITTDNDLKAPDGPDPLVARKKLLLLAQAYKDGGPAAMRELYQRLNSKPDDDGRSKPFEFSGFL